MSYALPKKYYVFFTIIAIAGGLLVFVAENHISKKEKLVRENALTTANNQAASEFKDALNSYATLISGIKSYIKHAEELPSQEQLQRFLKYQLDDLPIDPPLFISLFDTTHTFLYDFNKFSIDPSNLAGTSLEPIIGEEGLRRMEELMRKEDFYASQPTNLIEGQVALPLAFGILDASGQSIGYMTAVTDLKPIIDRVYENVSEANFVYRFETATGNFFDRTRVYGANMSYSKEKDIEYFKNFDLDESAYITKKIPFYNTYFEIGTAYKEPPSRNLLVVMLLFLWFFMLLGFTYFLVSQLYIYERKNRIIAAQKARLSDLVATKNKFFSIIAHDLRSPLSSVINFLDVLKVEAFQGHQYEPIVKALGDSTKNSLLLLDNLLKWSKVQTGQINFDPQAINLLDIAKDQIKVLQASLDKKNIKIVLECSYSQKIQADKNMMATIIRNLLTNAIKFSHHNSTIVTEISATNEQLQISVEDDGVGIPEAYLNKLFDVTEVTVQRGTANEKGSGLGLVLSKQFAQMHQGNLHIESELGKGTIVTVTIPLSK